MALGVKSKYKTMKLLLIKKFGIVKNILRRSKKVHWKRIIASLEVHQVVTLTGDTERELKQMTANAHLAATRMLIKIRTSREDGKLYIQRTE